MYGWYFSKDDCRLRYDDNRKIRVGITHTVEGTPELCEHGLHASKRLIDAISYAPGEVIWLVELGGEIVEGDDKCAATERTYIANLDNEDLLRSFARKCALNVIDLWDAPEVVSEYLETGNEDLRASASNAARAASWGVARAASWSMARDAARAAARGAVSDEISYAARAAARAAAWASACASASNAAWASAWDAARGAAWDAAWDVSWGVASAAAWDVAWDAAWDAALEKFNIVLTEMVLDEIELPAD